jgi:hypothetical protein
LRWIKAPATGGCINFEMVCCLLVAALLAPLGLWATAPLSEQTGATCCANRRMLVVVAVLGISAAIGCLLLLTVPQAAPFHHICRFVIAPRG